MTGGPYQASCFTMDAVKAASVINAFATACSNSAHMAYYTQAGFSDGHVTNNGATYQVNYLNQSMPYNYEYSCFAKYSGWFGDCYRQDPAFSPFAHGGKYVKVFDATNRLFECCSDWQSAGLPTSADTSRYVECDNRRCRDAMSCALRRYPRLRLDAMAYQMVYALPVKADPPVRYEPEDEDIPF